MLSCYTLDSKKMFKKPNGDLIIDHTKASLEYNFAPNIKATILVGPDMEMRPDLVAHSVYGEESKYDYILKFNGISNPFSLDQDRVLLIPDEQQFEQQQKEPSMDNANVKPEQKGVMNVIVKPKTVKDQKRLEFLQKKAGNKEILPPNVNAEGDKTVKFKDGKIVFGEDVTTVNKDNCPDTISRARLKEKLLSKKIFQ